jgi:Secretion system C-terminal sorting domain
MKSPSITNLSKQISINKSDYIYDLQKINFTYMKFKLSIIFSLFYFSFAFCQSPGGIAQPDAWGKVIKNTAPAGTFQYKDFSKKNKTITINGTLNPSLFNFNYSYTYNPSSFVSFLSKIESLKDATIFIVTRPVATGNPTDKLALMNSDWNPSLLAPAGTVSAGDVNEQSFKFTTTTFDKTGLTLTYPSSSNARPPARINTLIWHSFNSKKIVNSYGVNGESTVYVGKSFTDALNFQGEIPEFIIYRKALNDKEKARVESYLALKYGITLQPAVNYYQSKSEIYWHKANNSLFGNRIMGLGRDSNTALYQRQSISSDDTGSLKKLTFWTGTFAADNYLNTAFIEDLNFVTIGDNNASESPNTILKNGIKKINRIWLTENFGESVSNLNTNLKYKTDPSITLQPDEAFWLLIDRGATNTTASNFNGTNVALFQLPTIAGGYATFNNLKWANSTTKYNQFTFGVGPKMIITAVPVPMACDDSIGQVNFTIKGGLPSFTVNIHGTDNPYNQQFTQFNRDFSQGLSKGSYLVTITDNTGYSQTANFTVTPIPDMSLSLGPNQQILTGKTVTFDAAKNITSTDVITYAWFFIPTVGQADALPFATTPAITATVTQEGTYKCVVLNNTTGCSIQDEVLISFRIENSSVVFPNPSDGKFTVKIDLNGSKDINILIFDVLGKTLIEDNQTGLDQYQADYELKIAGTYFVKITTKDYTAIHQLIIK